MVKVSVKYFLNTIFDLTCVARLVKLDRVILYKLYVVITSGISLNCLVQRLLNEA